MRHQFILMVCVSVLLVVCLAASTNAGNVKLIVKAGTLPEYVDTPHEATMKASDIAGTVIESNFHKPMMGMIEEFRIDGHLFALPTGKIEDGRLEVESLGSVQLLLTNAPSVFVFLDDEQLAALRKILPVPQSVATRINVRDAPGLDSTVLFAIAKGDSIEILRDEPVSKDGYVWVRLRTSDGREGWAARKLLASQPDGD